MRPLASLISLLTRLSMRPLEELPGCDGLSLCNGIFVSLIPGVLTLDYLLGSRNEYVAGPLLQHQNPQRGADAMWQVKGESRR